MLQLFTFVFSIFGSFIGFIFNDFVIDKDYGITFGKLLFGVFLLCFILNKVFGMVRGEIEEEESIGRAIRTNERVQDARKKRDRLVGGRHSSERVRHNSKENRS